MDLVLRRLGLTMVGTSVLLFVLALVCHLTGTSVDDGSGSAVNSHASATWVIAVLGLVLLVHGVVLALAERGRWDRWVDRAVRGKP